MSEQGADEAGKDISFGIKFLLCCLGFSVILFVFASYTTEIAEFIKLMKTIFKE